MSRLTMLLAGCLLSAGCGEREQTPPSPGKEAPTTEAIAPDIDLPDAWPIYRGDRAMTGYIDGRLPDRLQLAWTFETGEPVVSSAAIADGAAYIGSNNGKVYAIDLESGEQRWSFTCGTVEAPTEVEAPPLVLGDRLYVGSTDGVMHALDRATGEQLWTVAVEDKIVGSANWHEMPDGRTLLLFGSYDAKLYAVDATTGQRVWTFSTESYVNGGPAVADDRVAIAGCDGLVYALDAATGQPAATVEIGHPNSGTVALHDGKALIGHYGNAFVGVDLRRGEIDWTYEYRAFPFFSSAATDGRVAVFGGRDRHVHAVDLATGELRWRYEAGGQVDSSPVIVGDRVIVGSDDGRVHLIDLRKGAAVWTYDVGESIVSSPALAGRWVVIGCEDGNVYAFTHGSSND